VRHPHPQGKNREKSGRSAAAYEESAGNGHSQVGFRKQEGLRVCHVLGFRSYQEHYLHQSGFFGERFTEETEIASILVSKGEFALTSSCAERLRYRGNRGRNVRRGGYLIAKGGPLGGKKNERREF